MTARKPIQIAVKYDGALVALTASGELFGQVRGEWDPVAGIEGSASFPSRFARMVV